MGTEFQYALNPLAANKKNISFGIVKLDDWDYLNQPKRDKQKSTVFINFEDSMDKLLERGNAEFIKKTMIAHENIFKHQVKELHRLYNTQKILMEETRNKALHVGHVIEDRTSLTKGFNLKRAITGENGQLNAQNSCIPTSFVSRGAYISTTTRVGDEEDHKQIRIHTYDNDGDGYEECDIDLTLGIGGKKKQMKTEGSNSSSSNHNQSNLPHWLYKSLGSNKI